MEFNFVTAMPLTAVAFFITNTSRAAQMLNKKVLCAAYTVFNVDY